MIWDNVALACPYYRYLNHGGPVASCVTGCHSEPECITLDPVGGWRPRNEQGRFITLADFYRRLDGVS